MPPRFFIESSTSAPGEATQDEPSAIEEVLAVVTLRTAELIIGADLGGRLCAVDARDRGKLGSRAQAQLAFHEVAANRSLTIDAAELHLFDLQMVELLRDAPGLNDPLYLYGSLRGPYPGALDVASAASNGQLTVSRGDLLAALIAGVEGSFLYERSERGSRCVHLLLPGEPAEVIDRGQGLILGFPLAETALLGGAANDLLAAQIFYDVLGALRADLRAQGTELPPLPVPRRKAVEDQLVAEGWRIDGDSAVRRRGRGIVASVLGRGEERRPLPRQGTLEEYAADATAALARMGASSPTTLAIRRRCESGQRVRPPLRPTPAAAPAPPPIAATVVPPAVAPRPKIATPRTEWIKDFVQAHRSPERPAPRLARPARVLAPESGPDWMTDFAEPEPEADADDSPEPAPPPDWSKDFE